MLINLISWAQISVFVLASTLLCLAPGPDNIFVLTQSITNNAKAGIVTTLGLCTSLMVHTLLVVLGITALFQQSPLAFNIIKYSGAAYLLHLAYQAFTAQNDISIDKKENNLTFSKLYKRGVIMNITNPKVAIFFLAFLPQFINESEGYIKVQLLMLGSLFIAIAFIIFSLVSLLANYVGQYLQQHNNTAKYLNHTAGSVFIALAAHLALLDNQ